MAEQIPYDVASSLINRLASAAFHEFGRIYGVGDELGRLKETVESIRAVLLDAEEKQEKNNALQNWIRRLKDVLHPADDLVDEFFIQEMKHKVDAHHHHKNKVTEVLHSFSPKQIVSRHKLAGQIEKIRKTFNDVVGEMSMLNLIPNVYDKQTNINERWETTSFIFEQDIIGRIDDKKEIISLLEKPHSHDGQNVSLIAIVGIGGLGKTALAQLVYNDVKVQKSFEKKMWVCVSDNFDVKTIVKKMFESLINSKVDDNLSLENLQNKLREHLTGKRYFLVLDDIWNESHQKWNQLRTYLMCGAPDSKVLVTTRKKIVAQTMGVSVSYDLNGLTLDDSWSLLKKISFVEDVTSGVNQSLESIGKKIAEKCKGVPLAIRTLAGLLQGKSKESEWINVLRSVFWRLCEDEESIMPVLKRSYQNLSPQLRQCFAYCSLYPKDWVIRKDELIQQWMAQGYLECSTENQSMEDVGNQFIKTFLMKSFFQDAEMSPLGDIDSFKMHDLMHDLAKQVAGNDCCYLNSETKRLVKPERLMHVSLEHDDMELLDSLDSSRLRTLIFLSYNWKKLNEEELSVISKFKRLRVLKLEGFSLKKMAVLSKKLKHLRCLILSNNPVPGSVPGSLLKSISNLVCLQTLVLKVQNDLAEFSTQDVSKLINLIHLDIRFVIASKEGTAGKPSLGGNCWISSFTNIVQIRLISCKGIQHLPPLERLPFLKSLYLYGLDDLEYIYYEEPLFPVTFFQSLEILHFVNCQKLRGWWRMGDDFNNDNYSLHSHHLPLPPFPPRLSLLSIRYCNKLTLMPTFPSLDKKLELLDCSVEILKTTAGLGRNCWLSSFTNIVEISLTRCQGIQLLPPLERLPFLKSLYLSHLYDLEYIYYEEPLFPVTFFQSLEMLYFGYCEKLRGWWRIGDDFNNDNYSSHSHHLPLPPFPPRLSQLSIYECPRLTLMPTFPSLDKKLKLFDCSVEILKATINTPFDFPPLSKLNSLFIGGSQLHVSQFPKDWAQNLTTSLRELEIYRFSNQQIQEMEIWFKDNLDCLQSIHFYSCEELEALPDWMCNLSSLQHIKISFCECLKSLPEGMSRLTNLKTLEINACRLLVEECQTETSATWPQISHIPNIIMHCR